MLAHPYHSPSILVLWINRCHPAIGSLARTLFVQPGIIMELPLLHTVEMQLK